MPYKHMEKNSWKSGKPQLQQISAISKRSLVKSIWSSKGKNSENDKRKNRSQHQPGDIEGKMASLRQDPTPVCISKQIHFVNGTCPANYWFIIKKYKFNHRILSQYCTQPYKYEHFSSKWHRIPTRLLHLKWTSLKDFRVLWTVLCSQRTHYAPSILCPLPTNFTCSKKQHSTVAKKTQPTHKQQQKNTQTLPHQSLKLALGLRSAEKTWRKGPQCASLPQLFLSQPSRWQSRIMAQDAHFSPLFFLIFTQS